MLTGTRCPCTAEFRVRFPASPLMEEYTTGTGQLLMVHEEDVCYGGRCPIHNPSNHALRDAPTHWRDDMRIMERICEHGIGHPDPDGLLDYYVHGCDGCCL